MSITGCVFLGLVSGFIASRVMKGSSPGLSIDLILAVVGAVVGGAVFRQFDQTGAIGFTLWSVFAAVTGAILVLAVFRVAERLARFA